MKSDTRLVDEVVPVKELSGLKAYQSIGTNIQTINRLAQIPGALDAPSVKEHLRLLLLEKSNKRLLDSLAEGYKKEWEFSSEDLLKRIRDKTRVPRNGGFRPDAPIEMKLFLHCYPLVESRIVADMFRHIYRTYTPAYYKLLSEILPDNPASLQKVLWNALFHNEADIRQVALGMASRLMPSTHRFIPRLIEIIKSTRDRDLQDKAVSALSSLAQAPDIELDDESIKSLVAISLRSKEAWIRDIILNILARHAPQEVRTACLGVLRRKSATSENQINAIFGFLKVGTVHDCALLVDFLHEHVEQEDGLARNHLARSIEAACNAILKRSIAAAIAY